MSFSNHLGQPIDMRRLMAEGAKQRYLERKAGVVVRKPTVRNGYAAPPGTGPEGERCQTCKHKVTVRLASKSVVKCELRRATWTNSQGTDILAAALACNKWVPATAAEGPSP